jgi:hypothetical protein
MIERISNKDICQIPFIKYNRTSVYGFLHAASKDSLQIPCLFFIPKERKEGSSKVGEKHTNSLYTHIYLHFFSSSLSTDAHQSTGKRNHSTDCLQVIKKDWVKFTFSKLNKY